MKKIFLMLGFGFILLIPDLAYADTCDYTEKARLQKFANNLTYKVDYVDTENSALFYITVSNITNELYLYDKTNEISYRNNNGEIIINNLNPSEKIQLYVYPVDNICDISYKSTDSSVLKIKYINLPYYNEYYSSPLCEGNEHYDVCSKITETQITKTKFENAFRETEVDDKKDETNHKPTLLDRALDFLYNYYVYILSSIIVIGTILILVFRNRDTYDFS